MAELTTDIVFGDDLHEALEKAGIIPPNCGDIIIEVKRGSPVIIHEIRFAGVKILDVVRAYAQAARVAPSSDSV